MVWKVAQWVEHYALSSSKCCWQAGWLLAGEGLAASLPQIQTLAHCRPRNSIAGTTHTQTHAHTHPHTNTMMNKRACVFFFGFFLTENATCFLGWLVFFYIYNPHHTLSTFCFPVWKTRKQKQQADAFARGAPPPLVMGCGFIWLCNLKKSISQKKRQSHHVNDTDSNVTHWFTHCIYLRIYLWTYFSTRKKTNLSCKLEASLIFSFVAVWFIDIQSFNEYS